MCQVRYNSWRTTTLVLLLIAHGESWEVAASHAVSNLIATMIEEKLSRTKHREQQGSFHLQYIPPNADEKPVTVPVSNARIKAGASPDCNTQKNEEQEMYVEKKHEI